MGNAALVLEDEQEEFFAPANFDAIDTLLGAYKNELANIDRVAEFMVSGDMQAAVRYFFDGNKRQFDRYAPDPADVFAKKVAVPALNAYYWRRALQLTDVRDFMPDKRRQEWDASIQEMKTPDFEEETVRATLGSLLSQRMDFLAEMVDGIFRGLSGEHVTNQPEGFGKRMIIQNVFNEYGHAYTKAGLIHDLRSVIAKFMGRDQPQYGITRRDLENFRRMGTGVWHTWDGGALRIRVYLNGNAHMEVNPAISWRLNQILAHLYPMAIPSKNRTRPKRAAKAKDFQLIERPIPFAVLKHIGAASFHTKNSILLHRTYEREEIRYENHTLSMSYGSDWSDADKHIRREVTKVLAYIGGTPDAKDSSAFLFDYYAKEVIACLLASGCIPDHRSHQYFQTPEGMAKDAVYLADIKPEHDCLEPSAGQGGIAQFMPKERTVCVEVSATHAAVLKAKGHKVEQADFLEWAKLVDDRYHRIVMNPPYSEGRWQLHLEAAAKMLTHDGKLVAILPLSAKGKEVLPGFKISWMDEYRNEFYGTSANVVIMVAER